MSITDWAPKTVAERLFPTCAPWCAWHYDEDTEAQPGCCWADDIEITATVEVMATWDEHRTKYDYTLTDGECHDDCPDRQGCGELRVIGEDTYVVTEEPQPPLSITVFRSDVPLDEGINFTSIESAEAAAHAILAMTARLRGDEQLAQVHLSAAASSREAGR